MVTCLSRFPSSDVPSAPLLLTVEDVSDSAVTVSWEPPERLGRLGLQGYVLELRREGGEPGPEGQSGGAGGLAGGGLPSDLGCSTRTGGGDAGLPGPCPGRARGRRGAEQPRGGGQSKVRGGGPGPLPVAAGVVQLQLPSDPAPACRPAWWPCPLLRTPLQGAASGVCCH